MFVCWFKVKDLRPQGAQLIAGAIGGDRCAIRSLPLQDVLGDKYGSKFESRSAAAAIEFSRNSNLSAQDKFFILIIH